MSDNETHSVTLRVPLELYQEMADKLLAINPPTSMNKFAVYLLEQGMKYTRLQSLVKQATTVIEDKGYAEDEFDNLVDWVNGK